MQLTLFIQQKICLLKMNNLKSSQKNALINHLICHCCNNKYSDLIVSNAISFSKHPACINLSEETDLVMTKYKITRKIEKLVEKENFYRKIKKIVVLFENAVKKHKLNYKCLLSDQILDFKMIVFMLLYLANFNI
ncbi:hypothetical protein MHBO_000780 [Bonamia ostreae]|uniref:Uncharacterized protein n=1 Tax=Bonamia ostreae TaxID=126728 RepID=A0ABV2AGS6_9EUKA